MLIVYLKVYQLKKDVFDTFNEEINISLKFNIFSSLSIPFKINKME